MTMLSRVHLSLVFVHLFKISLSNSHFVLIYVHLQLLDVYSCIWLVTVLFVLQAYMAYIYQRSPPLLGRVVFAQLSTTIFVDKKSYLDWVKKKARNNYTNNSMKYEYVFVDKFSLCNVQTNSRCITVEWEPLSFCLSEYTCGWGKQILMPNKGNTISCAFHFL